MRIARFAIVALAAAGLLYVVILFGLSAAATDAGDAVTALRLRSKSAGAHSLAADQALQSKNLNAAEQHARAALALTPRDVRALRVLALAEMARGRYRLGAELMVRAGALSWRDNATQVWLIEQAIQQQNFATASQRIDAMLRRKELGRPMLQVLHRMAGDPRARAEIIERLAADPDWRSSFFSKTDLIAPEDVPGHIALISEMRTAGQPVSRSELAWFLSRLVDQGDFARARQVWLATLSAGDRALAGAVFDGDFTQVPSGDASQPAYPFEWRLREDQGGFASIATPGQLVSETSLNLRSESSERPALAEQTIMLSPGDHRLYYDSVIGDNYQAEAFEWRLQCLPGNQPIDLLPEARRIVGAWTQISLRFAVPAGKCAAQQLQVRASGAGTASAGGREAWFDHVRVR